MNSPALGPDAGLPEFLAARARAATDGRLVLDVLAGSLVALGMAVWRPPGWISVAGLALVLASFGLWGIIDREVQGRAASGRTPIVRSLVVARALTVVLGFVCGVGAVFAGLAIVLGTWIS